jgi:SAM-dependent methyltransferase
MREDDPNTRSQVGVDEIASTYANYATSGYSSRWSATSAGNLLIARERDRFLVGALCGAGSVIDLGCGDGNLALTLDAAGCRPGTYLGIDILPDRLALARNRVPWGAIVAASALELPVTDASIDRAAANVLLSSVLRARDRLAILREAGRVLRSGGKLVVYDLRYANPSNRAVRPVSVVELSTYLPAWKIESRTITLLPPLARSLAGRGNTRYRLLSAVPIMRSHIAVVMTKP